METTLTGLVRKKYRAGLFLFPLWIVIALVVLYFNRSFIKFKILGPDEVTNLAEIMEHFDGGDRYVKIHADDLYYENYIVETITTDKYDKEISRKTTSFYVSAFIGDRFLLIELPYKLHDDEDFQTTDVVLTGRLSEPDKEVDAFGYVSKNMAAESGLTQQVIRDEYLAPVFLNTFDFHTAYIVVGLALALLLLSIIFFIRAVVLMANPRKHKVYRQMAALGDAERIERELEREMAGGTDDLIAQSGKFDFLTAHYILSGGNFQLSKTDDLAWAYRRKVKNNGVTTHSVCLRFRDGKTTRTFTVKKEDESERIVGIIEQRIPVLCGFSKEWEKMYSKELPQFLTLLAQRRDEFMRAKDAEDAAETISEN